MKKTLITLSAFAMAVMATAPAHAISAKYRQQLERSGCTQMTDGNGCDIHKTRAQNAAAAKKTTKRPVTMGEVRGDAETVLDMDAGDGMNYLAEHGWKMTGLNEYEKGGHKLRIIVDGGKIRNGQLIK